MVVFVNDIKQSELADISDKNFKIVTIDTKTIPSTALKGEIEDLFVTSVCANNTIYKYNFPLILGYPKKISVGPYNDYDFYEYLKEEKHVIYIYSLQDFEAYEVIKFLNNCSCRYQGELQRIHLIAIDLNNHEFDYLKYVKQLKNVDNITSLAYLNLQYFNNLEVNHIDTNSRFKDIFPFVFQHLEYILSYCSILDYQGENDKYFFNQSINDYELKHIQTYGQLDDDINILEDIQINKGKVTCNYLRQLRKEFALLHDIEYFEESCSEPYCVTGTCQFCEYNALTLWNKAYQAQSINEDIRVPISTILRLRIGIDGPGVRTLVCFEQCPLGCKHCINKEIVNKNKGNNLSVVKLGELIEKDAPYFITSGGGITFGGGEPLLYTRFIKSFSQLYPMISIALETSLNVEIESVLELLDIVDLWIIDIKDLNKDIYFRYTGKSNENVLLNLQLLQGALRQDKILIRVPHIPYFNKPTHVEEEVIQLKQMGFKNIELFEYKVNELK